MSSKEGAPATEKKPLKLGLKKTEGAEGEKKPLKLGLKKTEGAEGDDKKAQTSQDAQAVDDSHIEAAQPTEQQNVDTEEDIVFVDKAQLYRFDSQTKEWKERGTGDIKILKHKENNRRRILMRRNQTFKTCANHFIMENMEPKPHAGSDKAFFWTAIDYADGSASTDVLCCKFRNAESAQKFLEAFNESRKINGELLRQQQSSQ